MQNRGERRRRKKLAKKQAAIEAGRRGIVRDVVTLMRTIFAGVDNAVVQMRLKVEEGGDQISCKGAGCAACCYDVVAVTQAEAIMVAEAVDGLDLETRKTIAKQMRAWFDLHEARGTLIGLITEKRASTEDPIVAKARMNEMHRTQLRNRVGCPLLVDGKCSVYESRPMACRQHMATTDPERCWEFGKAKTVFSPDVANAFLESVQAAGMPITTNGVLPEMLRELCGDTVFDVAP